MRMVRRESSEVQLPDYPGPQRVKRADGETVLREKNGDGPGLRAAEAGAESPPTAFCLLLPWAAAVHSSFDGGMSTKIVA
jgi:hypothetical protein